MQLVGLLFITFVVFLPPSLCWGLSSVDVTLSLSEPYRLPNTTIPKFYRIQFEPHIDNSVFTFEGNSSVQFDVVNQTRLIVLHASNWIKIQKNWTELTTENGTTIRPVSQGWHPIYEFYLMLFNSTLEVGQYSLSMRWVGENAETMDGVFRNKYTEADGNTTSFIVATHFQATGARGAFPCWDEPGFRTPFEIQIKHHPNYTAISNMPIKHVVQSDGDKVVSSFEATPAMSTYLLTFILSRYKNYTSGNSRGALWAPEGCDQKSLFALNTSQLVVSALESYTGVGYALGKLDQAVLPKSPASGTEHWGIITYGYAMFSFVRGEDRRMEYHLTLLIAHEVTHQWFGNLVTPEWWNDLWLSEAFAVYFSYKILDQALESKNFVEIFTVQTQNKVSFEAEKYSRIPRPITFMPRSPHQIKDLFTVVTYRKGASIVRMLEHIVSEKVFQQGISNYLQQHKFGSVKTDDLWKALQEVHDKTSNDKKKINIKEIMEPWINQTGYPILNVTCDDETGLVRVSQQDFKPNSTNAWTIPLNFATTSRPNFDSTSPTHWLDKQTENFTLEGLGKNDWIVLNIQQTGFYRVNYDLRNWKRLSEYLNSDNYEKIHVINRAQFIWDLEYLYMRNDTYFPVLIDLMTYLHRERNLLPWIPAAEVIERLSKLLLNTRVHDDFKKFGRLLIGNVMNEIGYDEGPSDDYLLRTVRESLVPLACLLDHAECKNFTNRKLNLYLQNPATARSASLSDTWFIYCYGLRTMNESVWESFINSSNSSDFGSRIVYLGCLSDHVFVKKYLDLIIKEKFKNVTAEALTDTLSSIMAGNQTNLDFILDYFIENIDKIRQFYESRDVSEKLNRLTRMFKDFIKNNDQYEKFRKFLVQQEEDGKMRWTDESINSAKHFVTISQKFASMFRAIVEEKPKLVEP